MASHATTSKAVPASEGTAAGGALPTRIGSKNGHGKRAPQHTRPPLIVGGRASLAVSSY